MAIKTTIDVICDEENKENIQDKELKDELWVKEKLNECEIKTTNRKKNKKKEVTFTDIDKRIKDKINK